MALSVKKFTHALDCPEPGNQINVYYHPTSAEELCDGNGTLTAIFSDAADLPGLADSGDSGLAGQDGVCAEGMDVVFLVDYTASMSNAIEGVKAGIADIATTISNESGGDYRLGLVLFDENEGTSPFYSSSGYYQGLPGAQKINTASPDQAGYNYFFTCVEKMNIVGNITSFTNNLNAINGTNSSTEMALGYGADVDEPSGRSLYEVVANSFAGSWRTGVQRLVILITDATHSETTAYWQNTLTSELDNANVQLMVNSSLVSNTNYTYVAQNTQPAGSTHYGLNFTGAWTTGLQTAITDLCNETFVYTCDNIAIGWYQEVGSHTAYYWDGTAWSNTHECQYTILINLYESITGASLNAIAPTHPYYSDSDTFSITGTYGTTFNIIHALSADNDYIFGNITNVTSGLQLGGGTLNSFTDGGEGTPGVNNALTSSQFQLTGTVTQDAIWNVTVAGTATQRVHSMIVKVESGISNTSVTPNGSMVATGSTPASGWSDANPTVRTFTGITGSTHSWGATFAASPADYDLTVDSASPTYSSTTVQNVFNGNYTVGVEGISGTFTMPQGGGDAHFLINGAIAQPQYGFNLTATETIPGGHIAASPGIGTQETFTGYTGTTHNFTIHVDPDFDYDEPTLTSTTLTGDSAAITTGPTISNQNVTGTVTMPAGGGDANIEIKGTAVQTRHTFTVTFVDPFDDTASWSTHNYVGVTGAELSTTHILNFQQSDTTYTVTGVTSDSSDLTATYSGTTITTSLVMPQGGGSAIVTATGSNTDTQYTYTVHFTKPTTTNNYGWGVTTPVLAEQTQSASVTGTSGTSLTVYPPNNYRLVTNGNYEATNIAVSSLGDSLVGYTELTTSQTNGAVSFTYGFRPYATITIPSGGGSETVNVSLLPRALTYEFDLLCSTDSGTSGVVNISEPYSTDPTGVSRTDNGNGTYTIHFTGAASTIFENVDIPILPNNNTDYDTEIVSWSTSNLAGTYYTAIEDSTYNNLNLEAVRLQDFTMPSLDPRVGVQYDSSTFVIDDTVTSRTLTFTLTTQETIANVAPNSPTQTYTGAVGSTHLWTSGFTADAGYTFNITSVSKTGTNASAVTITDSTGTDIGGSITMPSGGGNARVTAAGTSELIQYTYTITFSESVANAAWDNGASTKTRSVTLAPGGSTTIFEQLSPSSGYEFSSLAITANSGNITRSITSSGFATIGITMPSNATGNQSSTVTVTGSTVLVQRSLSVNYSESIIGAFISSGSGSGATPRTTDLWTGVPGATGSVTRYLAADINAGYSTVDITSVSETSNYISALTADSGVGAGVPFTYTYTIPPSNTSATITINGTATYNCTCSFLIAGSNPTTFGGTNGWIEITLSGCTADYLFTINDAVADPTLMSAGVYRFEGLSAGTYTVHITDANGCTHSDSRTLTNPSAPKGTTYYYYDAEACDGLTFVLRSTTQWPMAGAVLTNRPAEDGDPNMCLLGTATGPSYNYSILDSGSCDLCFEFAP